MIGFSPAFGPGKMSGAERAITHQRAKQTDTEKDEYPIPTRNVPLRLPKRFAAAFVRSTDAAGKICHYRPAFTQVVNPLKMGHKTSKCYNAPTCAAGRFGEFQETTGPLFFPLHGRTPAAQVFPDRAHPCAIIIQVLRTHFRPADPKRCPKFSFNPRFPEPRW